MHINPQISTQNSPLNKQNRKKSNNGKLIGEKQWQSPDTTCGRNILINYTNHTASVHNVLSDLTNIPRAVSFLTTLLHACPPSCQAKEAVATWEIHIKLHQAITP